MLIAPSGLPLEKDASEAQEFDIEKNRLEILTIARKLSLKPGRRSLTDTGTIAFYNFTVFKMIHSMTEFFPRRTYTTSFCDCTEKAKRTSGIVGRAETRDGNMFHYDPLLDYCGKCPSIGRLIEWLIDWSNGWLKGWSIGGTCFSNIFSCLFLGCNSVC